MSKTQDEAVVRQFELAKFDAIGGFEILDEQLLQLVAGGQESGAASDDFNFICFNTVAGCGGGEDTKPTG